MSLRSFDSNLIEAMEACRPGSDDVSQPEMAALSAQLAESPPLDRIYKRLRKLDGALVVAFRDVPVPEGLGDRILAALAADSAATPPRSAKAVALPAHHETAHHETAHHETAHHETAHHETAHHETAHHETAHHETAHHETAHHETAHHETAHHETAHHKTAHHKTAHHKTARRVLLGTMASAAAAALIVAVGWPWHPPESRDPEAILSGWIAFANNDPGTGGEPWPQTANAQTRQFPISSIVDRHARIDWRPIRDFLDRGGVAYDITSREGIRATLYVVNASGEGLPGEPAAPYPTGRSCATTWREDGLLYVLVVWGDQRDYERFLAPAHGTGPVA